MALLMMAFPGSSTSEGHEHLGRRIELGGATGVLVGGLLSGSLGWRSVFFVTVPVSVVAVALARHVLD